MSQQGIFVDDDLCIDDITQKLFEIRNTLGLKQSEIKTDQDFITPFSKDRRQEQLIDDESRQITNLHQELQSHEKKDFDNTNLQFQLSNLQGKINELKNLEIHQPDKNASMLEKEIFYLQQEVKSKNQLLGQQRIYVKKLEDDLRMENQILKQELMRSKQLYEKLIDSSDLQTDLKEYIMHLEIELSMTKQELNLFTQKLSEEQQTNIDLKDHQEQLMVSLEQEFKSIYQYEITELQNICKILCAEKLNHEKIGQNGRLNKMYQEAIDEKILLESKLENLESKLRTMNRTPQIKNEFWMNSVKIIYDRRLHEMKKNMIYWKNRAQQVEQIVIQWIKKLKDENSKLKKDLMQKQTKMFKVFEGLIREIYITFAPKNKLR